MARASRDDEEYCFYEEALPEWGISLIMLAEDEAGQLFYPVRPICDALQVDRPTQAAIIQTDSRTKKGARDIKAPTRGGRQEVLYLRRREVAVWLALIDPERVGPRARGRVEDFQNALWQLADKIVFKRRRGIEASAVDTGIRVDLHGEMRGEFICCGRRHIFKIADGEMRVYHVDD